MECRRNQRHKYQRVCCCPDSEYAQIPEPQIRGTNTKLEAQLPNQRHKYQTICCPDTKWSAVRIPNMHKYQKQTYQMRGKNTTGSAARIPNIPQKRIFIIATQMFHKGKPPKKIIFLGLCPELWVDGGQES